MSSVAAASESILNGVVQPEHVLPCEPVHIRSVGCLEGSVLAIVVLVGMVAKTIDHNEDYSNTLLRLHT